MEDIIENQLSNDNNKEIQNNIFKFKLPIINSEPNFDETNRLQSNTVEYSMYDLGNSSDLESDKLFKFLKIKAKRLFYDGKPSVVILIRDVTRKINQKVYNIKIQEEKVEAQ